MLCKLIERQDRLVDKLRDGLACRIGNAWMSAFECSLDKHLFALADVDHDVGKRNLFRKLSQLIIVKLEINMNEQIVCRVQRSLVHEHRSLILSATTDYFVASELLENFSQLIPLLTPRNFRVTQFASGRT